MPSATAATASVRGNFQGLLVIATSFDRRAVDSTLFHGRRAV
jgi:hypothetical protein